MSNRLSGEKSPYLRQHAGNPVDWHPWGEEAFQKAKAEGKPIFLSVGYSTCHWCHVMERESFEDAEVARALNASFVSIKVDREERPQVDSLYMDVVQAMTGSGGWPMSVIMTPEGEPFFGGTYFPKADFLRILSGVSGLWNRDRTQVQERARSVLGWLRKKSPEPRTGTPSPELLDAFAEDFRDSFDPRYGGRQGSPKFPSAYAVRLLLRVHARTGDPDLLAMAEKTLDELGRGGICDHLGGGFHRYSTDEMWLIPHFEKMLYDQAALLRAYVEAFQVTGKEEYALIAREIADYVLREMTHPEGGFYSAEDADSEGEEGKFYVWGYDELTKLLTDGELRALEQDFFLPREGNFEGGTITLSLKPHASRAKRSPLLKKVLARLFKTRARRVRPLRDEKVLTEWNALFVSALAHAGRVLGEARYAQAAARAADFVLKRNAGPGGGLLRRSIDGEAAHPATLEDHAFLVDACLELLLATGRPRWYDEAVRLQALQDAGYGDAAAGGYHRTSAAEPLLIARRKEFEDSVIPSGNSIAALNLLRLAQLGSDDGYAAAAERLFASVPETVERFPAGYVQLLMALDWFLAPRSEIVLRAEAESPRYLSMRDELFAKFRPNALILACAGPDGGVPLLRGKAGDAQGPLLFVCAGQACRPPVREVDSMQHIRPR